MRYEYCSIQAIVRDRIKSSCPVRKLRTVKENIAIFVQLFECISPASGFFMWKKIKNVLIYLDVSSILFSVGISGGVCQREQQRLYLFQVSAFYIMIWFSKCWLLKGQTLNLRVCPFLLLLKQPLAQPVDKELIAMDKKRTPQQSKGKSLPT